MYGVLGHDSALYGETVPVTTWVNEMNFVMNHEINLGPLDLDQQSSALSLYHGCPIRI